MFDPIPKPSSEISWVFNDTSVYIPTLDWESGGLVQPSVPDPPQNVFDVSMHQGTKKNQVQCMCYKILQPSGGLHSPRTCSFILGLSYLLIVEYLYA
jgi:hypothetical protein